MNKPERGQMSSELEDEELQDLLNELDEREENLVESTISDEPETTESPKGSPKEPSQSSDEPDPLDDVEDIEDDDGIALRPVDVRKMKPDEVDQQEIVERTQQTPSILSEEIEKYRDQLSVVTREVLDACRSDRQEAQDVINDLAGRLRATSGQTGPPPKALVDGLVKAVEVKAGINQNAIKMMDTNARFLSSIKPSINTQNNLNVGSDSEELKRILNSPVDDA